MLATSVSDHVFFNKHKHIFCANSLIHTKKTAIHETKLSVFFLIFKINVKCISLTHHKTLFGYTIFQFLQCLCSFENLNNNPFNI